MPHFFISYRSSDREGNYLAHMVFRELKRQYGEASVFFAIDSKSPGLSFPVKVERALRASDAVLVIMGSDWLRILRERQDDPRDWVRFEIAESLKRSWLPVVPVCHFGVEVPRPNELPESLQDLGWRDGVVLDPFQDFDSHLTRLLNDLERVLDASRLEREEMQRARARLVALLRWRAEDLTRRAAREEAEKQAEAARLAAAQLARERAEAEKERVAKRAAMEQEIEAMAQAARAKRAPPSPAAVKPLPVTARSILAFPRRTSTPPAPQTRSGAPAPAAARAPAATPSAPAAARSAPGTAEPLRPEYYKSSEKWTLKGAATALAVGGLASIPFALLYSLALMGLTFVLLGPFLALAFGFVGCVLGGFLVHWQKIRSLKVAGWVGVIIGLEATYESWVLWVHAYLPRSQGSTQSGISGLWELFLSPNRVWQAMYAANQHGAWSVLGYRPTGIMLWILWSCELLCIAGFSSLGRVLIEEPFCESCGNWCAGAKTRKLKNCDPAQLRRHLEAKDLPFLASLGQPPSGAPQWIELNLWACATCGTTNGVSARAVTQSVGADIKPTTTSTVVLSDLLVTAAEHRALLALGDQRV